MKIGSLIIEFADLVIVQTSLVAKIVFFVIFMGAIVAYYAIRNRRK